MRRKEGDFEAEVVVGGYYASLLNSSLMAGRPSARGMYRGITMRL